MRTEDKKPKTDSSLLSTLPVPSELKENDIKALIFGRIDQTAHDRANNAAYRLNGITVGLHYLDSDVRYGQGSLSIPLPLPLPPFNWVGSARENYLIWKLDRLETKIIRAFHSFQFAKLSRLTKNYQKTLTELETKLEPRWANPPDLAHVTLDATETLSSPRQLYSKSALEEYRAGRALSESVSACASWLVNVALK